jgi:hypothetical protein
LELLLFLRANAGRAFASEELVRDMRASEFVVRGSLQILEATGLVKAADDTTYRYSPAVPQLDDYVRELETLYRDRPTSVIGAIFSSPADRLQTFADAFKLKKD